MTTNQNNPNRPQLTAIDGGQANRVPSDPDLNAQIHKNMIRAAVATIAVAVSLGGAKKSFDHDPQKEAAAEARAESKKADNYLDTLHASGKEYTVKVESGESPSSLANEFEREAHTGSESLRNALEKDISDQAANGSTMLQTGQTVTMPDVPDGVREAPDPSSNKIAPISGNSTK